ncbi:MAG: hypothetical protein ACTSRE_13215 [Promethearchaeota archaeon]
MVFQESSNESHHYETNLIPYLAPAEYIEKGESTFGIGDVRNDTLNMNVFGYSLQIEEKSPITRDLEGSLSLELQSFSQDSTNINVLLDSAFGSYEIHTIPVSFEIIKGLQNNLLFMYTIDKPSDGFFMNLAVYPSESFVSLAFDGGNKQIIYDGISNIGYCESNMILGSKATLIDMNTTVNSLNPINETNFNDYLSESRDKQLDSLYCVKSESNPIAPKSAELYPIHVGYGIVHNIADNVQLLFGEDIADKMAEASSIDYTLYRDGPSESTVKSDLQYYNKEDLTYDRKIYAYHSFSHGTDTNADWYWPGLFPSRLSAAEVENLWGYSGGNFYYPYYMLIKATNCHGMDPLDMADAFIDYGANAYVGNTDTDYNLEEMDLDCDEDASHDGFWEALIDHGDTVSTARSDIISEWNDHNTYEITWSTSNIVYEGSGSATIS